MIAHFVLLAHAALAVLLLAAWWLPARIKEWLITGACIVGVGSGAVAFALHNSDESWRSVTLGGPTIAIASAAAMCAWLLVGVLDLGPRRYGAAIFTGVGATGLGMFAAGEWTVPAILFWAAGSLAISAMVVRSEIANRTPVLAAVVISDALLIGAMLWHALDRDAWALPSPVAGAAFWLTVAAAVVRAGALPRIGLCDLVTTGSAPAVALLAGGGAVIAGEVGGRPEPWAAVALLALATAIAAASALRHRMSLGIVMAWPAALGLATLYVGEDAVAVGGIAIVASATVFALLNERSSIITMEGAATISLVPITIGFSALAVSATDAFFRTDLAESAIDKAPWVAIAALLPVALAASFVTAARMGRSALAGMAAPRLPMWGARAVLAASLISGAAATTTGDLGIPRSSEIWLLAGAGVAAGLAAVAAARSNRHVAPNATDSMEFDLEPLRAPLLMSRGTTIASIAVGFACVAGIAYLTYEGLRQGFL